MELTQDHNLNELIIRSYQPGQIRINSEDYTTSLIVTPEQILDDWAPQTFGALRDVHLQALLDNAAELIILGTGSTHRMLSPEQQRPFIEAGIGIEAMSTHAACKTYNVLMAEGRQAIAGLIIR